VRLVASGDPIERMQLALLAQALLDAAAAELESVGPAERAQLEEETLEELGLLERLDHLGAQGSVQQASGMALATEARG
jgi:predicted ABC-type transport system involved in lysophospholipase L1 biosynthesis ATPase subunit